jgi:hypothetical protein
MEVLMAGGVERSEKITVNLGPVARAPRTV